VSACLRVPQTPKPKKKEQNPKPKEKRPKNQKKKFFLSFGSLVSCLFFWG
jgi:hypothetical protein